MAAKADTIRRIFVSDIHMGDRRSRNQPSDKHPYGWLSENRQKLFAKFVGTVCSGVDEVIILGDLFDEWICPAKLDPTAPPHPDPPEDQQFYKISEYNVEAIKALNAHQGRLIYVAGNHDMLVKQETMKGKKGIFPNIDYTPGKDGHDLYQTR